MIGNTITNYYMCRCLCHHHHIHDFHHHHHNFSSSSLSGGIEVSLAQGVTGRRQREVQLMSNPMIYPPDPPDILNETKQMIVLSKGPTRSSKQVGEPGRDSKYAFDRPRHCLLTELRLREGAILVPIWHSFC